MKAQMTIKASRGKCEIFPFQFKTLKRYLAWRYRYSSNKEREKLIANPTDKAINAYYELMYRDVRYKGKCVKAFMRGVGRNDHSSSRPR